MKHGWKTTAVYLAIVWTAYLVSAFTYNVGLNLGATALYFILIAAGVIAMIILLIRGVIRKRGKLAALAMALAILPLLMMGELRDAHARMRDFLFRDARMEMIDDLRSGRLIPDGAPRTQLPANFCHLAEDGEIRVFELSDDRQVVGFYHFSVILGGAWSTVYCSDGKTPTPELLNTSEIISTQSFGDGWFYVHYE